MFDHEEVGFVICAACGARIKANRERCLRCESPLVAWEKPELLPPWLQRLGGGTLVFGIVAVVILVSAAAMFVESRSRTADEAARPSKGGVPRPAQSLAPSGAPAAPAPLSAIQPLASLDTPRRGSVDLLRGDFSRLRDRYEEQLEKKPADPELLNNLGLTLERLGRTDEAIARFESALHADPQNFSYHYNIAHASSQRSDWDRSIAEYRLAAGLLPSDYATRYNLGMALHLKGDEVGAISELQTGIGMAPGVAAFHLLLGVVFEKLGRIGEAGQEFQTYLATAPSAPDADRVRSHLQLLPVFPRS
jgi:tetratricopeptide (TPR) repeat protein